MKKSYFKLSILLAGTSLFLNSCENGGNASTSDKPLIVCTTTIMADAVENIVGETYEVQNLMGPGVDPHLYTATQNDLKKLSDADIVVYHGLKLEGKMEEIFENLKLQKPAINASEGIAKEHLIESGEQKGHYDPHIWFSVPLWKEAVQHISNEMQAINLNNASDYYAAAEAYLAELDELDAFIREEVNQIPESQRVLITTHDAFRYFGNEYGMEVRGLQGISTASEIGLKDITEMVDFIVANSIKAVFVESSVSAKALTAVEDGCKEKGHDVILSGPLYADALGDADGPAGNYIGMFTENVTLIKKGLMGEL